MKNKLLGEALRSVVGATFAAVLAGARATACHWVDGLAYGLLYYVVVNAVALPWLFGDAFPWQLGWGYVYPSLVVHLVFGLSIAVTARKFNQPLPARS